MPVINGCLKLEENAPFEEITKEWYNHLFECVPPYKFRAPYQNLGWFICGEPYSHDFNTGEAYHYLCFCYNGKYYAGCRKVTTDVKKEISNFCMKISAI